MLLGVRWAVRNHSRDFWDGMAQGGPQQVITSSWDKFPCSVQGFLMADACYMQVTRWCSAPKRGDRRLNRQCCSAASLIRKLQGRHGSKASRAQTCQAGGRSAAMKQQNLMIQLDASRWTPRSHNCCSGVEERCGLW